MKRDETGTLRRSLVTTPETSNMSIGPEGHPLSSNVDGVSENLGYLFFGSPYNNEYDRLLGSISGSAFFRKLPDRAVAEAGFL